jgi:uncharacterized protein YqjF (DUF2071 family)
MDPARPFLTAEWRSLAMLNYRVDPALLTHLTPKGTEVDCFDGSTYISLVGFRFTRTRVRGLPIPFHSDFDEVNLRFYVKRTHEGEARRGVVFVREIVPRWAIAKVARLAYHENYVALPMRHQIAEGSQVVYSWRHRGKWSSIKVECSGDPTLPAEDSVEQFITEHYWGYVKQPGGSTLEYHVEHPPWRVWNASAAKFDGDASAVYGEQLARYLTGTPVSAFLAEGSAVAVYPGFRIA